MGYHLPTLFLSRDDDFVPCGMDDCVFFATTKIHFHNIYPANTHLSDLPRRLPGDKIVHLSPHRVKKMLQHLTRSLFILETAILSLLVERGPTKTICPSEAAKLVAGSDRDKEKSTRRDWEALMEPARAAARRLVAQGKLFITQHGEVVDPSTAKGPIRLRLR
jgi:Protein of unknown function (DUF3253)